MTSPNRLLQPDTLVNQATSTGMLAAADFSPGTIVAGRFKIARLLGMGGMGLVYEAHDTELDIDVALKLLRPELASRRDAFERFRQELLLARQVSSPHVVRIHDLVKHNDAWLISMDYVPGQSLERLLEHQGALPPEQAIAITRQLALGLAAAHRSGVVHRDLKPANVLVNEQGDACITDFGVARSAGTTGITDSGVIIGTPAYLSPEQARAEPLDGRSDLYALGLILFEMLTGTQPFRGGTPAEMMVQRIVRDPPSATTIKPDLPDFAVRLCAHLVELKPAHRFQTAEEVVQAIDARRLPKLHWRSPVRAASAFAAVVAMAIIVAFGAWQWRTASDVRPLGASTAAAQQGSFETAALPWVVDSKEPGDQELTRGISRLLADNLASRTDAHSADATRVARALAELGFDPGAAQRQLVRVFEVMGAQQLILGSLSRSADGLVLSMSLWQNGAQRPSWTQSSPPTDDAGLPAAMQQLQRALLAQLELDADVPGWPAAVTLRELGSLQLAPPAPTALDAAIAAAEAAHLPALWWSLQESLRRSGRVADAATVARRAKDALANDHSPQALRAEALALVLLGETDAAAKILKERIAAVPSDNPLRVLLAQAEAEAGRFDAATRGLQDVVVDDQRNIEAWYALGKFAIQSGDAKRAVDDYLVRAQVLANRLNDQRMQADVANALGIGYRRLGQLTAAAERLEYAQALRGELGDGRGQVASLSNLASVRSIQGNFDAAEAALAKARAIIEPLGDVVAMGALLNEAGALAEERGNYRDALDQYRDSLRLRQTQGDSQALGESQINVGFAYYQLGEFDNAQTYWQQAASTYEGIDDRIGVLRAREGLGWAAIAHGDWAQARISLERSLSESESMQMAEERSTGQAGLAELDSLEGRIDSGLDLMSQALQAFELREDLRNTLEMKLLRSAAYSDLGAWDAAAQALASIDESTLTNGEQASKYAWREGEIALGRGDAAAALIAADRAIDLGKARSYGSELSARLLRARALAALRRTREAQAELKRVDEGVARYASVPLRLLLAETSLALDPETADATYREARALLAHLPAYGRAFQLHARAAVALRKIPATANDAQAAARAAWRDLDAHTPEAQRPALQKLAQSLGLDTTITP